MTSTASRFFPALKMFGMTVLALMLLAAGYAVTIAVSNWNSISV